MSHYQPQSTYRTNSQDNRYYNQGNPYQPQPSSQSSHYQPQPQSQPNPYQPQPQPQPSHYQPQSQSQPTDYYSSSPTTTSSNIDQKRLKGFDIHRQITVSNIPYNVPHEDIVLFLSNAMERFGLILNEKDPIISYKPLKSYIFLLNMATEEDAANILNLSGIIFQKRDLVIKRLRNYHGDNKDIVYYNFNELLTLWKSNELPLLISGKPSKVLIISNLINPLNITSSLSTSSPEANQKILLMLEETCQMFGKIIDLKLIQDSNNNIKVLLMMNTVEEATNVLINLKLRTYNNNLIHISFYPEYLFINNRYDSPLAPFILTKSHGIVGLEKILLPSVYSSILRFSQ